MEWTVAKVVERLEAFVGDIDPASKKGQKRAAILEAATRMFAEQGYRGTSMDELASTVGVAKGTLYLYFPKKIDLLFACAAHEKLRWMPELATVFAGDEAAEIRLKRWITAILLLPSRSPLMCRLLEDAEMVAMFADYPKDLLDETRDATPQLLQPLLDEIAGPGHRWSAVEVRDRVHVISSLAYIAPMLRHELVRPGMSPERFAAIFADLIVDGIRPRDQPEGESP